MIAACTCWDARPPDAPAYVPALDCAVHGRAQTSVAASSRGSRRVLQAAIGRALQAAAGSAVAYVVDFERAAGVVLVRVFADLPLEARARVGEAIVAWVPADRVLELSCEPTRYELAELAHAAAQLEDHGALWVLVDALLELGVVAPGEDEARASHAAAALAWAQEVFPALFRRTSGAQRAR